RLHRDLVPLFDDGGTYSLAAFQHSENDGLAAGIPAMLLNTGLAVLMHVPRLAADESFVHLDFASEFAAEVLILHGKPNPMEQEPCRLLSDAERAMQFPGRDAIAVAGDQPHGLKPFVQAEWRILHDRPRFEGELAPGVAI